MKPIVIGLVLFLLIASVGIVVMSESSAVAQDLPSGDVNSDGMVNIFDLVIVASVFGQSGLNLVGDVNRDGTVNLLDLVTVASHFGETTSGVVEREDLKVAQSQLNENRNRWLAENLTDYQYLFRWNCFCLGLTTVPVTITVRGGVVESVLVFSTDVRFLEELVDGQEIPQDLRSEFVDRRIWFPEINVISQRTNEGWLIVADALDQAFTLKEEAGRLNIYYNVSIEGFPKYHTILELFDFIEDAIRREAHGIQVTYDSELGFPQDGWIDYEEFIADEEMGFLVSDLIPLDR